MIVGVGVDVVEIDRFAQVLTDTPNVQDRIFTSDEITYCGGRIDRLAARFAAKEAVAKALGTGICGFGFRDVEIVNDQAGRPTVTLRGTAATVAADRSVTDVLVSLSHSKTVAAAFATAVAE